MTESFRAKPEPQSGNAPPLNSTGNDADNARNNAPQQKNGSVRRKEMLRPVMEVMGDGVHKGSRHKKEGNVKQSNGTPVTNQPFQSVNMNRTINAL